jgi:hypothetical protein
VYELVAVGATKRFCQALQAALSSTTVGSVTPRLLQH